VQRPAPRRVWRSLALPWKVFLGGVGVLGLVLALMFAMLSRWAERSGEAVVQRELEQSADLASQYLSARQRSLAGGARVFVQDPNFRSFVHEHLRDELLDQALEAQEQLDAEWVFVVDESGVLLAKSDEPSAAGVSMGNVPLIAGALQGNVTTGFGVSGDSLLFQTVAVPIVVPGQAPIGALVATKAVDSVLARDVKAATSADIVFYVRDGGSRIVVTSFDDGLRAPLAADVASQSRGHASVRGTRYATYGTALTTSGGAVVGGYVVMSARDAASADIAEVRRALVLAGLLGIGLIAAAAVLLDRRVARPLRALATVARRAKIGDGQSDWAPVAVASRDEVSALTEAVTSLADDVRDRAVLTAAVTAALPSISRAQATGAVAPAQVLSMVRVQGASSRLSTTVPRAGGTAPADAPAGDPAPGDVMLGRYRIDAVLATGELGVTYRARDRVTSSTVALKRYRIARLPEEPTSIVDALREEIRGRRLVHRNVVRLREAGEDAGIPFVTMDYVEGLALDTLLRAGGPLADEAVVAIAKQLCHALAAAQASGAVHGSLAPHHILLGYDGVLRVSDFIVARLERRMRGARGVAGAEASARASEIPQLAGATVGAPEYMSPEQLIGEEPTAQTDLYAAGVVLYECVTGATPFRTDSPLAFLAQKLGDAESAGSANELRASRPTRSAAAPVLSEVISRMIAPDTTRRASSAGELLVLLERAG
jgi:eukaryotic-like serine/threonine-protein kinase